ncbi:MAG: hypothetical protein A2991_00300 [Candidatus Terrybacteria bacterium RIFCSPLOWO2_01_FULL_58_14]|uniref:Thioester reductase (TE) domain-containing protein n=2 Tax=Candidatus Terryibacteriota TaxID=1817920 RepID=A0A1G2PYR6_9BACT|nr:MAG: hypothetical protein A2682_00310 [Candidatus Terrybacteria bacterium RIFCSPHIGHO2_01_FULL_58_15]OHA52751.1 MAG: hypothetical protein A2991_00300 [Candidatus Terrybacteria bacterium RIFCSPLOWO2_01_FULL_58_14]
MDEKTIILTGATGSLGKLLLGELLASPHRVVLLIRAPSQYEAEMRAASLIRRHANAVQVIRGDLAKERLGLSETDYAGLLLRTTHILHAAASTRFDLSLETARRSNVGMTQRMLGLAEECVHLERFGFLSTAFVAGKRTGLIREDDFAHGEGFLNTYEQSKYEAEALMRVSASQLPMAIFRPSLIITPYEKRFRSSVSALTLGLFLIRKGFLPILPGDRKDSLDIVTAHDVAVAIVRLLLKPRLAHLCYHLTSGDKAPKIGEIADLLDEVAGKKLNLRLYGSEETFRRELKKVIRFRPGLGLFYKKISTFVLEMAHPKVFDRRNLLSELEGETFGEGSLEGLRALMKG